MKINKEDKKELVKLYKATLMTPVTTFNSRVVLVDRDTVGFALKKLWEFLDKLGKEYGFYPTMCTINLETGEVNKVEK